MSKTPAFDWTRRQAYDWTSPAGLSNIKTLIQPYLAFEPREFQVYDSTCILNGQDVFCLSATGDGKSALIYIPALVRKEMITVVVEPTNALEDNMVSSLKRRGLTSIVINAEEIEVAKKKKRNLWDETKDGQYQVVALSPEMLKTREYGILINDPYFRQRWGVLAINETHLVDHWGTDFHKAYAEIWTLRSRGPEHLTFVAMSATVEKGQQMNRILQRLGYREDTFLLDKRDCQRHNVDFIFRTIQYTCSGFEFRDLDWLVPCDLASASDVPKRIVYSDTIETGHRIAIYLRGLLPSRLQNSGYTLIRHMHSMNCSECKKEGLQALGEMGNERTTAIFVATAVWEVGLDVPDIASIILFPAPASTASIVQRAGRPARAPGMRGEAIVYVKKTEIEAALEYAKRNPLDSQLLDPANVPIPASSARSAQANEEDNERSASTVDGDIVAGGVDVDVIGRRPVTNEECREVAEDVVESEHVRIEIERRAAGNLGGMGSFTTGIYAKSDVRTDSPEGAVINSATSLDPREDDSISDSAPRMFNPSVTRAGAESPVQHQKSTEAVKQKVHQGKGRGNASNGSKKVGTRKPADLPHSEQGKMPCFACLLIITAHARGLCISRQINIIYNNPGIDHNCGRCSLCLPRPLPDPHMMPLPTTDSPDDASPSTPDDMPGTAKVPAYLKLTHTEVGELSQELVLVARRVWRKVVTGSECLLIGPTSFIRPDIAKRLTADFHLLSSIQDLENCIRDDWRYWDRAGGELWAEISILLERFHEKAAARHQKTLANRRGARERRDADALHADLIAKGLHRITRIKLVVPDSTAALNEDTAEENSSEHPAASSGSQQIISASSSPLPTSTNPRATTPEPGSARLASAILSPSNRLERSPSARSHADQLLGDPIPTERFYGTLETARKRSGYPESEAPPAKARKTLHGRKVSGATSQAESTASVRPRKENTLVTTGGHCRSARIRRS